MLPAAVFIHHKLIFIHYKQYTFLQNYNFGAARTDRRKEIYYCHVRSEKTWFDQITFDNWVAFTIVDNKDKEWLKETVSYCLDKGTFYTCSAGQLANLTEDYFDEKIVWREVKKEEQTGQLQDYERTPVTTSHTNFDEGFWFAITSANNYINEQLAGMREVICIDCTVRKVRRYMLTLIDKINKGWLPPDDEVKNPIYGE